jgi:hypothetical protein
MKTAFLVDEPPIMTGLEYLITFFLSSVSPRLRARKSTAKILPKIYTHEQNLPSDSKKHPLHGILKRMAYSFDMYWTINYHLA